MPWLPRIRRDVATCGFYLGWLGNPGRGRALGVNNVKFTGEVLKNYEIAFYQIDMKRILIKEGTTVGLA